MNYFYSNIYVIRHFMSKKEYNDSITLPYTLTYYVF